MSLARGFLAARIPQLRRLIRAYDYGLLAIAIALPALHPGVPAGQAAVLALPATCVLLAMLLFGSLHTRFAYGSPPDIGALVLSLTVAAATAAGVVATVAPPHDVLLLLWAGPLVLLCLPRVAAGLAYRRIRPIVARSLQRPRIHWAASRRHPRTAWIISLTPALEDPRVVRQADALWNAGWNVVVFAFPSRSAPPESWTIVELVEGIEVDGESWPRRFFRRPLRAFARALLFPLTRFSPALADVYYWLNDRWETKLAEIRAVARQERLECDLVAHHDFYTTPIASRLAAEWRVPFTTDVHEYARGQYMHRPFFRLMTRHYVHRLQQRFYPRSAILTIVCEGIASLLRTEYELQREPVIVRNVSLFEPMPFHAPGRPIRVLYHGLLCEARGLEETIASLPLWRPEFELVLRGPGLDDYLASLRAIARRHGVESRLRIEPPVPYKDLVAAANRCDIGFFASDDYSPQKKFTAPNKLFEYVMAGLALCVSDLPEMRKVVVEYDVGRTFPDLRPETIAAAVNGFDADSIARFKRRALDAAKTLNWEREREKLVQAYESVYRSRTSGVT